MPRHRKVPLYGVPRISEYTFAPFHGKHVCKSRAGRWRDAHDYIDGICFYCDRLEVEAEEPKEVQVVR